MKENSIPQTWETFIQLVLKKLDIPTRKDVMELHSRLDKIENLVSKMRPASQTTKSRTRKTGRKKTAVVIVHEEIAKHPQGVNFAAIKSTTGYDDKKLRNIIYRLDKIGKIKKIGRGIYKPV